MLTVHPNKQFIKPVSDGIDFVGYVIKPDYVLIRKRVAGDWKRKMEVLSTINQKQGEAMMASYLAHSMWANSRTLVDKHRRIWNELCRQSQNGK